MNKKFMNVVKMYYIEIISLVIILSIIGVLIYDFVTYSDESGGEHFNNQRGFRGWEKKGNFNDFTKENNLIYNANVSDDFNKPNEDSNWDNKYLKKNKTT